MSDSAVADPLLGEAAPGDTPATPADPEQRDVGAPFSRSLSLVLAVVSGAVLTLAFPPYGWWPLAPIAVAGLAIATRGRRSRFAGLAGFLFGLAFFIPHLHWSGIYVGKLPWFALATVESVYFALMALALPLIWRVPGRAFGMVLAGSGLWVAQEAVRDRGPFGGFPWGRLAFSQAEAPTVGLAALGGAPLVTGAVAAIGSLLAWAVVATWRAVAAHRIRQAVDGAEPAEPAEPAERDGTAETAGKPGALREWGPIGLALVATAAVGGAGLAVPLPTTGTGTARVAAVQGNVPRAGLEFNAERRAVLDNHVKGTLGLAARVQAGQAAQPDLVIWPENSSDIDPLRNPDAAAEINEAVALVGAPTLVGTVIEGPGDKLSNTSMVWRPGTGPGTGQDSIYVKRHPAPFAEYIPYRSFFRHFSKKVDLVQRDFISGDKLRKNPVGVLAMGKVKVGDVICFEVAYDNEVRDPVKQGATMLAVQTNNATFGRSAESVQQLAMSQLRAVETGRTVVHISTVGVSAIILPDGTVQQRSGPFTADVLESEVPLRTSLTVATRVGEWPEGILAGLAVALLLAGAVLRRRATVKA
jgi:apolipoprotein N-acyltransferase